MFGRAWTLMRASGRVLWMEQALILLAVGPIVTFAAIVVGEAAVAAVAPTAAVALLVPAIVLVVCASMFWSAAIVAGANEVGEGRSPTVAASVATAARHLPAICAWAFFSLTIGVAIRLAGGLLRKVGVLPTYTAETAWSVATMLVLPAIVVDGATSPAARQRSRALLGPTWKARVAGQLGFDLVALVAVAPTLLLFVVAALLDVDALMSAALLVCFGSFIAAALATSACLSVYRAMLYRHVTGRAVPVLYDDGSITRELAPA
jgi:hypothetical protein